MCVVHRWQVTKRDVWTRESKLVSGDISISLDSASRGEKEALHMLGNISWREVNGKVKTGWKEFPVKRKCSLPLHFSPSNRVSTGEVLQDESIKLNYFYSFD